MPNMGKGDVNMPMIAVTNLINKEYLTNIKNIISGSNLSMDDMGNFRGNPGENAIIQIEMKEGCLRPVIELWAPSTKSRYQCIYSYDSNRNIVTISFMIPDYDVIISVNSIKDIFDIYCNKVGKGRIITILSGNQDESPDIKSYSGISECDGMHMANPGDNVSICVDSKTTEYLLATIVDITSKEPVKCDISYSHNEDTTDMSFVMPNADIAICIFNYTNLFYKKEE